MKKVEIICIVCPIGCRGSLVLDSKGNIVKTEGYRCKKGREYAKKEFKNPVRVLTATVFTSYREKPLLPVKTSSPIPKERMMDVMKFLKNMKVTTPVKTGDVLAKNILNLGVDIVATSTLRQPS